MKLRLPAAFIQLPAVFVAMFAMIAFGVAWSQRPYSDWTVFLILFAVLALFGAIYLFLPVDWIADDELTAMEHDEQLQEREKELLKEVAEGTLESNLRWRRYRYIAIAVAILVGEEPLRRGLHTSSKIPGHGDGMAFFGRSFAIHHVLGRDWTGWELFMVVSLTAWLCWELWKGFGLLRRAQKRTP